MAVNGVSLGALGIGVVLVWSGVQNKGITQTVQDIVSGKKPQPGPHPQDALPAATPAQQQALAKSLQGASGVGPSVFEPLSVQKNQAIAKLLAAPYGWSTGPNWDALVILWNSESGWSNTIWNTSASCGGDAFAYGIPQACGHGASKTIPGHGSVCPFPPGNPGNPPECGGIASSTAQIAWGLAYIHKDYGQPINVPLGGY